MSPSLSITSVGPRTGFTFWCATSFLCFVSPKSTIDLPLWGNDASFLEPWWRKENDNWHAWLHSEVYMPCHGRRWWRLRTWMGLVANRSRFLIQILHTFIEVPKQQLCAPLVLGWQSSFKAIPAQLVHLQVRSSQQAEAGQAGMEGISRCRHDSSDSARRKLSASLTRGSMAFVITFWID